MPERELTFAQAVREALAEEMRRDSRVCIFGEDVAEAGTPFKVLSGLVEEFGAERVVDTPISEAGFTGVTAVSFGAGAGGPPARSAPIPANRTKPVQACQYLAETPLRYRYRHR